MTRLFWTLYVLILFAAFAFMFGINPVVKWMLINPLHDYSEGYFRGTFALMDDRLSKADDMSLELERINALSGYPVKLLTMEQLDLDENTLRRIKTGKVVVDQRSEDGAIYAQSSFDPELFWELRSDPEQEEVNHRVAIGTARMVEEILAAVPESQWPEKIETLNSQFSLPLNLITMDDPMVTSLTDRQRELLEQKRVVGLDLDSSDERYYYRLADSDRVLLAGSIPLPFLIEHILPLVSAALAFLLAFAIYLWMRPLWKNLRSLERANQLFGKGDFTQRAAVGRFSPIKSISESFNSMATRVQSLISSHKDLTNAVSHELRTPLARMRFGLEMLQSSTNEQDKQRFLREMETDIEELDSLVGELLTYARFEREMPELDWSEHEVVPWVERQLERARRLTNDISIYLHYQGVSRERLAYFEGRLLGRALSNLLGNAVRHAASRIDVVVQCSGQMLVLNVDDDGAGVPEAFRDTIFDPFTRADQSRARDTGGFGIGLTVVQQVAQWHKGEATVGDSPLGGARFTLELPQPQ